VGGGFFFLVSAPRWLRHPPDSRLQPLLDAFYKGDLGSDKEPGSEGCHWEISRPAVDGGLPDAMFDGFAEMKRDWIVEPWDLTCDEYINYLSTASGYRAFVTAMKRDPLQKLRQDLLGIVNANEVLPLEIPYFRIAAVKRSS
jgi:hypothetical protein